MSRIDEMTESELERLTAENKEMREVLVTVSSCRKAINNITANVRGVLDCLCDLADKVLDAD